MNLKILQASLERIRHERSTFLLLALLVLAFYWLGDSITLAFYLSKFEIRINFLNMELSAFPVILTFLLLIKGIATGVIFLVSMMLSNKLKKICPFNFPLEITSYSILFAFAGYGIALTVFNIALLSGIYNDPDPEIISGILYTIIIGVALNTVKVLAPKKFNIFIIFIVIIVFLINPAYGTVYSYEWENETKHTMKWGDKVIAGYHEIEFRDFSSNVSMFNVNYNGSTESVILSTTGEGWNSTWEHEDLKVRLMEAGKEKATITTWILSWKQREESLQKLFLEASGENYVEAGETMNFEVKIENKGNSLIENLTFKLNSEYFTIDGKKNYTLPISRLNSNYTRPLYFNAYAPFSFGGNASLNLDVEGWDYNNRIYYMNNITKDVMVRSIEFSRDVFPKYIILNSDRQNMTVFLYINNPSGEDIYAYVEDESLNTTKGWFLKAGRGESKTLKYEVKPALVGNITLQPAKAFVSGGGLNKVFYSGTNEVVVHGSSIYLKKTLNDNIISIDIINIGDSAAFIRVKDSLPDGVLRSNGSMEWEGILQPLGSGRFEYSLTIKDENLVSLPPAIARYTDSDLNKGVSESNTVTIPSQIKVENQATNSSDNINNTNTDINNANINNTNIDNITASIPDVSVAKLSGLAITKKHIPGFEISIAVLILIISARFKRRFWHLK